MAPKIISIHELPCGNPCTSKISIHNVISGTKEEEKASRKRSSQVRGAPCSKWKKKTSHFGEKEIEGSM